jgi:hypothetical protein
VPADAHLGFHPDDTTPIPRPSRYYGLAERHTTMTAANDLAVRRALESAGVEFIDENGGGPGLRLRKCPRAKPAKR